MFRCGIPDDLVEVFFCIRFGNYLQNGTSLYWRIPNTWLIIRKILNWAYKIFQVDVDNGVGHK